MNHMHNVKSYMFRVLKDDQFLAEADWQLVEKLTVIRNPYVDKNQETLRLSQGENSYENLLEENQRQEEENRLRILQQKKASYWRQYSKGKSF